MGNASGGDRARLLGSHAHGLVDTALAFIAQESVLPDRPLSDYRAQFENERGNQGLLEQGGRFVPSKRVFELRQKLSKFMEDHIYPMEKEFNKLAQSSSRWTIHPEEERLKELAKSEGLWNLFIPLESAARAREVLFGGTESGLSNNFLGAGLSNLEYGFLCEIMGRSGWAPQVFNCGAPDTGNMEVLLR
jgi:acyl-CoA dehydrogenase